MKILSLFDGLSGAYLALQRAGINISKYYSSEIDKYAIAVSRYNFPDIIRFGDVKNIVEKIDDIDLLIGGSPCQDLSVAKKNREGLQGKRSGLFWEYVRVLKLFKPKYFLLENVASMKKSDRDIITETLGIEPIMINSALVSAQQRKRLYWTNIPNVALPEDKHIYLKDILETGYTEKEKSYCITATYNNAVLKDYFLNGKRQLIFNKPVRVGYIGKGGQGDRIYSVEGKSICLSANGGGRGAKTGLYQIKDYIRKLMPIECERLQTIPDNFTKHGIFDKEVKNISDTQRYKMLGNGFTVDVIAHILKNIGRKYNE